MNVTEIKTEKVSYDRVAIDITLSPSLEDMLPGAGKASLDIINQLVGRKWTVRIMQRHFEKPSAYYGNTRVYASIPTTVSLGAEHPPYSVIGEDPENDKAWRAFNKLEDTTMQVLVRLALKATDSLLTGPSDYKVSFSRKAGCSMCPCSPGYILRAGQGGMAFRFNHTPVDMWISEETK